MRLINIYIIIITLILGAFKGHSQESLGEIPYRTEQIESSKKNRLNIQAQSAERAERADEIIYLYDTLEIPIVDEFTRYRIKIFPKSIEHPSVFDSSSYLFRINGQYLDTFRYSNTPARNIVAVPGGGTQIDTVDFYSSRFLYGYFKRLQNHQYHFCASHFRHVHTKWSE